MTEFELYVPLGDKQWINANQRDHHYIRAGKTKTWREHTRDLALEAHTPFLLERVEINAYIYRARNGRYDPGNLYPTAKACVDGLVDAGLVVDDDYQHVDGPFLRHGGKDKHHPGVRLEVREL